MKIVAATKNPGKLREFKRLAKARRLEIEGLADYPDVLLPPETGTTYLENAAIKARAAAHALGRAAFGDDSGLEVDAIDGLPGVYSARFGSPDGNAEKNIAKLLGIMKGVEDGNRSARFRACLVLVFPDNDDPGSWKEQAFEGVFEGSIARQPAGKGGFGYDPVFISPQHAASVADLTDEQKDLISHRGQAMRKMLGFIEKNLPAPRD
ncbi:MAG: RdgB/HAM1 family non-canonical purine NTP pyrophosphatase [Pseudomonadota bacterium]